ncbi:MAG: hypothetical protein QM692_18430 [Thermomicrobiales bacterium]
MREFTATELSLALVRLTDRANAANVASRRAAIVGGGLAAATLLHGYEPALAKKRPAIRYMLCQHGVTVSAGSNKQKMQRLKRNGATPGSCPCATDADCLNGQPCVSGDCQLA